MNTLWRIVGAAIFLGGWSVFGATFEFAPASRDISFAIMVPILVVWGCVVAAMICTGVVIMFVGNPFVQTMPAMQEENGESTKEALPKIDFDQMETVQPYIEFFSQHSDRDDKSFGFETRNALRAIEAALNGATLPK